MSRLPRPAIRNAAAFLDLETDATANAAEDLSITGVIRDGARLWLKRRGHTATYAYLEELEQKALKHKGCPGIARVAHLVKGELMRGEIR